MPWINVGRRPSRCARHPAAERSRYRSSGSPELEPNSHGTTWTKDSLLTLLYETFSLDTIFATEYGVPVFSDPDSATRSVHPERTHGVHSRPFGDLLVVWIGIITAIHRQSLYPGPFDSRSKMSFRSARLRVCGQRQGRWHGQGSAGEAALDTGHGRDHLSPRQPACMQPRKDQVAQNSRCR
jgi:hypothetical protein